VTRVQELIDLPLEPWKLLADCLGIEDLDLGHKRRLLLIASSLASNSAKPGALSERETVPFRSPSLYYMTTDGT
jgi:hypothetical protein